MTNPWVIAAVAGVGVVLLVVAIVLVVRARRRAPAPASLASVWDRFRQRLPVGARGDSLIVVLGERLAGKSRSVVAGFELDPRPVLAAQDASDDPRLTCFAGRQALVQELSGDVLEDTRAASLDDLRALWRPYALGVSLVLFVLDTRAPSYVPAGLKRLGGLLRDKVDLITALRGSPPRVRVCLTHLDESAEGFLDTAAVARATGHTAALALPAGRSAAELSASLRSLDDCVSAAVRTCSPEDLGRVTRFSTATGPRTVSALAPFLDALLAARPNVAAPPLDGIVLAGLPPAGAALIGDPLALDAATLERDARALDGRRRIAAAAVAAAAALLLVVTYAWHWFAVDRAVQAVAKLSAAAKSAESKPQKGWATDSAARDAEAAAADALESALDPAFPPLRLAYPKRKQDLAGKFLQPVRELYLFPAAQAPERSKRICALATLYAADDEALEEAAQRDADAWAAELDVPPRIVRDYLARSDHPWRGTVPPPPPATSEVSLDDWLDWLRRLDDGLRREKIQPDELADLQARGRTLTNSVAGALEVRGLEDTIKLLRAVRGADLDVFLGKSDAELRAPKWVTENWVSIEALLAMVRQASLAVPAAKGKTLTRAVDDFGAIARTEPGSSDAAYPLVVGNEVRTYRPEAWGTLIRASRAALYSTAFAGDVRASGRSLFFAHPLDYSSVSAGSGRSRGPYKSLPGTFTAGAVANEVKPPLLSLDAALDAARLPRDERADLTRLVRDETTRYARDYRTALWDYVTSFRLDATSPAGLRADIEDMVSPASWFTDFWVSVATNATVDPESNDQLQLVADALSPFLPLVAVMTGDKGKYPALDKYYALLAPLPASLDAAAPPAAPGAALEERLSPLGKLGLTLLDAGQAAPLPQASAWLDGARLLDPSLRKPFVTPVELVYAYALQALERTLDQIYREQLRPLVAPLLLRFPLDPRATTDASPDDLLATVGPKGSFKTGLDALLAPVCKKAPPAPCAPKAAAGYRAVRLPGDSLELSVWSARLAAALWDDGGKPKPIALSARPRPLPQVKRDDQPAVTRSFLRSGGTTIFGFNQAPAWQALPVTWSTSDSAGVGMDRTTPGGDAVPQAYEAEGAAWRFYHLICNAPATLDGTFTWLFDPPVSFDIAPDPWSIVVPPSNQSRRCVQIVARK